MRPPRRRAGPFDPAPLSPIARILPALTIMAGSLITIWPFIATIPALPPFGLLMLLGWRLLRADALPIWGALPLGLFDDLLSGQPFGSSMLLWQLCFFAIDLLDQRIVYRDFWQDWMIAAGATGFCLILGRAFATPLAAHVDTVLLLQAAIAIMLFPVVARLCAWLDGKRGDA
ncbi:rod shape-determining protein MreD [Sphingomonas hylomeconis]|uniref:Rod shape-determining protein MreD n=1 Tax=Sphingomonas hylomeconis TaxID=1395958 RepID=A0ABV7SVU1_9SPHN|nr:rod shape-determining protein MreD [Sphingomonas hylomeconis]